MFVREKEVYIRDYSQLVGRYQKVGRLNRFTAEIYRFGASGMGLVSSMIPTFHEYAGGGNAINSPPQAVPPAK